MPFDEDVLAAAHQYRQRGWRVIAIQPGGKRPIEKNWQDTPPLSGPDVQALFEGAQNNVGIATGAPSGFWVLDIDLQKPGTGERLGELLSGRETLPRTRVVQTPSGGYHYYFAMPDFNVTNSAKRLPDGIDVRGTGGQVVAPPSRVENGVYTVLRDGDILRAPEWLEELVRPLPPAAPVDLETLPKLTDLPERERERLSSYVDRAITAEIQRLRECREKGWGGPGWNQTTFEVSCSLIELANSPWAPLTTSQAREIVLASAPRDANFGDAEIEGCFASALKTVDGKGRAIPEDRSRGPVYPGDPLSDPMAASPVTPGAREAEAPLRAMTDLGNAHRMVDLYRGEILWIEQAEKWATYADGVWRIAGAPAGRAKAQEMIEGLIEREAHRYSDIPEDDKKPSPREAFVKWAIGQQNSARITACLKESTGRRELQADLSEFDTQEHLFNCANGVVDLRTGELLSHDPALMMMLQSPVAYRPDAEAKRWQAFLERCLPDEDTRRWLQKAMGYSLTASMDEQAMFIHHGSGANGKSVFLIIAGEIAGDYGQVVPRTTLLAKGNNQTEHPTSVARMRGRRFLQASETAAGRRLDEETVKGLTGGEQQSARFMGADFFDFTPTGKIHFVTNHLPKLTDAESIWRRLHLIGWRETIPIEERDPRLAQKIIEEELEGVLSWAVQGAVLWYREGHLQPTMSMRSDLADYRTDQDILGEFLDARLQIDEHGFVPNSEIYGAYTAWCFNNGIRQPMTSQDLVRALRERGWVTHRKAKDRGFRARVIPAHFTVPSDPLVTR
jgi:putative DNA primase/helicase